MVDLLQKKALMIAPSYGALPEKMWLKGTLKDVEAMKKVLLAKCAFEEENITVLQGDQATKDNILKVFNQFTCEDGSVVFVYYSGHGVYLKDSQDEGLLPTIYEWPVKIPRENACITGNDLVTFLDKLAKKRVRTTMIFDCCHSGQLYRVTEFDQATGLKPRQVILERGDDKPPIKKCAKTDRGGWTPEDKDCFFYFAACSPVQVALEEIDRGGRLTMAVVNVLNNLESLEKVSYDAFSRLVNKEFKERQWDKHQTPQFEAANSQTIVFGTFEVVQPKGGIRVTDVPADNECVLDSGFLQNMRAGKYEVFETTVTAESVEKGSFTKYWVATIDVNEGSIETTQSIGTVQYTRNKEITVECLAYLKTPESVNNNVYLGPVPDSVPKDRLKYLLDSLKASTMLNVSRERNVKDPDLITINVEKFKEQDCWVARRRGKVLVPPISIGDAGYEGVMANNICRYIRYHIVLERAESPTEKEDLLEDVTLKLFKVKNVKPYTKHTKKDRIKEGLEGTDISLDIDERPMFKAHETDNKHKLIGESGDAFLFQVINNNKREEDTIHICVMLYQFDGAVKAIYPKNKRGKTIELRGGDTAEEIYRVFIPKDSLRKMVEPDLDTDEPKKGVDTLVLYASNKAVDYDPIEQSCIQTDPDLMPRASGEEWFHLSNLDDFLKLKKRPVPDDDLEEEIKYCIKKIEMTITKENQS